MKKTSLYIIRYVLYFKAIFWVLLALMEVLFAMDEVRVPIYGFLFLLNAIVFFCIGASITRAPKEIFRGAIAFLLANIFLVFLDGFGGIDVFSIVLDAGVLSVLVYQKWFNFQNGKGSRD